MMITQLRIDGQVFFLTAETDRLALKSEIVAAVRSGADFVTFNTHGHGEVDVLMTPHIPVRFETVERTEQEVDSWESDPPSADVYDLSSVFD